MPERRIPDPLLLRTHPDTRERVERLMDLKLASPGLTALPRGRTGFEIAPIFGGPVAALPHRWPEALR